MAKKDGPRAPTDDPVLARYRVAEGKPVRLAKLDPGDKACFPERGAAEAGTAEDIARIDALQDILYAQGKHALLVVLQATDTGGKDGTIRKVFGPVDPLGLKLTSFKVPTAEELAHDFLWRIHKAVPGKGEIGIFNRSHYEDVLVVRVHQLVPPEVVERRYDQINAFEQHLAESGVTVVKLYLHISKEEQKQRLLQRIEDPTKRWKFNPGDLKERALWDDYQRAYEIALARCSKPWAPWYVVPADRKWYRNAVVARIIRRTLEGLDLRYPPDPEDLDQVVID
jgi:PPK2 family polyphosphate:nucleotide phosphotransferase